MALANRGERRSPWHAALSVAFAPFAPARDGARASAGSAEGGWAAGLLEVVERVDADVVGVNDARGGGDVARVALGRLAVALAEVGRSGVAPARERLDGQVGALVRGDAHGEDAVAHVDGGELLDGVHAERRQALTLASPMSRSVRGMSGVGGDCGVSAAAP
eukprot:CAMPEP_0184225684 /NCGR_PEP_ID=MMETSP0976-20121227/20369_1 /TAXON_ID=483370 /ORGANISM="non described non described, Strain CCMP2097" /LENGTH=161 /DNA_ID=CAMNT_0026530621 /DNA_START=56 /DNA_END=539 /DNA_ORIENTATION=-